MKQNSNHLINQEHLTFQFPQIPTTFYGGYYKILSISSHLPSNRKTTAQLIDANGMKLIDKIVIRTTGVESLHVADSNESDSDLLSKAALKCLSHAGVDGNSLSKIIVNKLLGDRILPPTSARMQRKLNVTTAVQSMDIDGGSNSFFQALLTAGRCLDSGDDLILIASGGVHLRLMRKTDSRTAFLYGDASTAVLLQASSQRHMLAQYEFSNPNLSNLHNGGDFYHFVPRYLEERNWDFFSMGDMRNAVSFYKTAAQHTLHALLRNSQCSFDEIDMFFITQMSLTIWQQIVRCLGIPDSKLLSVLPHTGNTLAANIPLQIESWMANETTVEGKKIMIISLGEGCMGGGCIYQF